MDLQRPVNLVTDDLSYTMSAPANRPLNHLNLTEAGATYSLSRVYICVWLVIIKNSLHFILIVELIALSKYVCLILIASSHTF